jgi:hypothetical protein
MHVRQLRSKRSMACAVSALVLAYGIYARSERLWAHALSRERTLPSIERAIRHAEGNAEYWLTKAELLDQAGLDPGPALRRAAGLDRLNAAIWIRLGLTAEAAGNFGEAQCDLIEAARVSHRYEPRWTLANYYFRRGMTREFWSWTRQALELAPRDERALFQLCWKKSNDAGEILSSAIPDNRVVIRDYVHFLLEQERLAAAEAAVRRILRDPQPDDRDVLLMACDRFLDERSFTPAIDIWNALCETNLSGCRKLNPAQGVSLANGDFGKAGFGTGFGWRIVAPPGVSATLGSGLATVYYSGSQPERCEALWQFVPVLPEKRYLLRFDHRSSGIPAQAGPRWLVRAIDGNSSVTLASSAELSATSWRGETMHFEVPPGVSLLRLGLTYVREPGVVRIEGSVSTRAMELVTLP